VTASVLDRGRISAARLVGDRWALVTNLATELVVRGGVVSCEQVTRILAAC
jgi:hypothetical protein